MGAEMVGTDCHGGPKAGIIVGSDAPFSGLPSYSWRAPPAQGQTLYQNGAKAPACILQLGKLRGEGACLWPQQKRPGTEMLKLSSGIPATLPAFSIPTVCGQALGLDPGTTLGCRLLLQVGKGGEQLGLIDRGQGDNFLRPWVGRQADPSGPLFLGLTKSDSLKGWTTGGRV